MLPTPTPEIVSVIPSVSLIPAWFAEAAKWIAVILGVVTGIISVVRLVARPLKTIDQKIDAVDHKVASVDKKVDAVQDDVADMQYDRLNQAYEDYMHKGWCPKDAKVRLSEMCDKYTKRGRNHLAPKYRDKLTNLPDDSPDTRRRARAKQQEESA